MSIEDWVYVHLPKEFEYELNYQGPQRLAHSLTRQEIVNTLISKSLPFESVRITGLTRRLTITIPTAAGQTIEARFKSFCGVSIHWMAYFDPQDASLWLKPSFGPYNDEGSTAKYSLVPGDASPSTLGRLWFDSLAWFLGYQAIPVDLTHHQMVYVEAFKSQTFDDINLGGGFIRISDTPKIMFQADFDRSIDQLAAEVNRYQRSAVSVK